eukprot:CAMPEP_0117794856 /NCGR_PEP_ID=MMETSP0948-20121206/10940_1 /TAXON_ID=44440 /ORGANISM="Chattonella subsalsa, Strain CCMP2191" /LENGTH=409 /DNA_ID=CAMNT_0005625657 /DNA_START=358 /DNA_END=1589 /DNA_ORIENTATION=-
MLKDELEDEDEVLVQLAERVNVSQVGTPDLSRWATLAFAKTDAQLAMRKRVLEDKEAAAEEERRQQDEHDRALRATQLQEKASDMRKILEHQLVSEEQIKSAMEQEWYEMNLHGTMDRITSDDGEQAKLYELMEQHFIALSEIFKHYCAVGAGMGTNTMEFIEFTSFVGDTQALKVAKSQDLLQKVFVDSVGGGRRGNIQEAEIGMHEFFVALIRLAKVKYTDKLRSRNRDMPSVLLSKFLDNYVLPLVDSKLVGASVKSAMTSNEILAMFYDYLQHQIVEVFEKYAASVEDNKQAGFIMADSLNIAEFEKIIADAGLMGSSGGDIDDQLTQKETRQAFAGAQAGRDFHQHVVSDDGQAFEVNDDQQMDYPEFLEALARIGILKWEDDRVPCQQKIEGALSAVGALAEL